MHPIKVVLRWKRMFTAFRIFCPIKNSLRSLRVSLLLVASPDLKSEALPRPRILAPYWVPNRDPYSHNHDIFGTQKMRFSSQKIYTKRFFQMCFMVLRDAGGGSNRPITNLEHIFGDLFFTLKISFLAWKSHGCESKDLNFDSHCYLWGWREGGCIVGGVAGTREVVEALEATGRRRRQLQLS